MRWLSMLPLLETQEDLLLMQTNCIPIKRQTFVDFEEDMYRMGHFKKGQVAGISAQIFHHSTAVKVVEKAKDLIKSHLNLIMLWICGCVIIFLINLNCVFRKLLRMIYILTHMLIGLLLYLVMVQLKLRMIEN